MFWDLDFVLSNKIGEHCEIEIFCGDINLNILNINKLDISHHLNCLTEMGYHFIKNKVTMVDKNSAIRIDHLFIKCKNQLSLNSVILNAGPSDLYPILLNLNLNKSMNENKHS